MEPPPQRTSTEDRWIDGLTRRCPAGPDVLLGPGDDAAVLRHGQVVSVDTLVEGVHFDDRLSPVDIGYKAVAVSVSDMAAMGARPTWMVLSLSAPPTFEHIDALAEGVALACRAYSVGLAGGDTTRSPGPLVIGVTMMGFTDTPALRSAAHEGDDVWVTGTPGLAGAGYLMTSPPEAALAALRRPRPPVAFGRALVARGLVHAMMDLSDGLAADAPRIARASGVSLHITASDLPVHPALPAGEAVHYALVGGDDYELLFTAPASARDAITELARTEQVRVTRIGRVHTGEGCILDDRPWPQPAFSHFDAEAS